MIRYGYGALPDGDWQEYRRVDTTRMVRVEKACAINTGHGVAMAEPGDFVAVDARGFPYPIDADEHALIYTLADPEKEPR